MSASIHYDSLKSLSQPSHVQWRTCTYWNFGWNWAFALLVSFRDHLDRESPVETRNITVHVAQWPMPLLARDVSKILTTSASFFVLHPVKWRTLLRLPLARVTHPASFSARPNDAFCFVFRSADTMRYCVSSTSRFTARRWTLCDGLTHTPSQALHWVHPPVLLT